MKKNVAILTLGCVLLAFGLVSCGQDVPEKNDNGQTLNDANQKKSVYEDANLFKASDDIIKTEGKFTFQNVTNMASNNPQFYKPAIFANKMELKLFKTLEFGAKNNTVSPVPTYFGFDVYTDSGFESIVADESKYLKDLGYASVFDTSNNLAYMASTDYVYCSKLTINNQTLSWKLELKNARISDRTIGNQIVVYDLQKILLIDTKTVSFAGCYQAVEGIEIIHVIPGSGKIWVFAKEFITVGKEKQYKNNGLISAYSIDPGADKSSITKYAKGIKLAKAIGNGIVFCIGTEFHVFEGDTLNVFDVAKIHEGVKIVDTDSNFNSIEVDGFWFSLEGKQYFLDVLNPERKIELPTDFKILHSNTRGHAWDYCVAYENGWSGYDALRGETTWSITIDDDKSMLPYLSTENGVLLYGYGPNSDTYVVKAYTPKK